jgi:hypothetical protein
LIEFDDRKVENLKGVARCPLAWPLDRISETLKSGRCSRIRPGRWPRWQERKGIAERGCGCGAERLVSVGSEEVFGPRAGPSLRAIWSCFKGDQRSQQARLLQRRSVGPLKGVTLRSRGPSLNRVRLLLGSSVSEPRLSAPGASRSPIRAASGKLCPGPLLAAPAASRAGAESKVRGACPEEGQPRHRVGLTARESPASKEARDLQRRVVCKGR